MEMIVDNDIMTIVVVFVPSNENYTGTSDVMKQVVFDSNVANVIANTKNSMTTGVVDPITVYRDILCIVKEDSSRTINARPEIRIPLRMSNVHPLNSDILNQLT